MKKLLAIALALFATSASAQNYLRDNGQFQSVVTGTNPGDILINNGGVLGGTSSATFSITINGTPIVSGTNNCLLYDLSAKVGCLAPANNGVLVTSGLGAPSISTTLPSGLAATNMNLTTPILGVAAATSLALGGATIGSNALAVTGNALFNNLIGTGAATDGSAIRIGNTINTGSLGGIKVAVTWTGAITNIAGIFNEPVFNASANVTTYYGLSLNGPSILGTVANLYGLRIGVQAGATTINQAIWTEGNQKIGFGTSNATAHLHVNENTVQNITPPPGTLLYFSAADNSTAQVVYDSFGNSSALSQVLFRRSQGTAASPTHLLSGDTIGQVTSEGYDSAGYSNATGALAFIACADWTSGPSHCTDTALFSTPAGGTNAVEGMRLLGAGNVKFTNSANFSANGVVATVLGSAGPSGAHTTVQKWLTIVDNGGTTGYIPVF